LAASSFVSPPFALTLGLAFGLIFRHPYAASSRVLSKYLLQGSVVGLGFGMNLHDVLRAGRNGFIYTLLSITFAMLMGTALGSLFNVQKTSAFLISIGTAICGGSAIAAVGPVSEASDEQMAVSLATVFLLNSIALLLFPAIGVGLGLTQTQFGLWAALAIHDTSSVVGAAAKYGAVALVHRAFLSRDRLQHLCWSGRSGLQRIDQDCEGWAYGDPFPDRKWYLN